MKLPWFMRNDDAAPNDASINLFHNFYFYVLPIRPVIRPFYVWIYGHWQFSPGPPPLSEMQQPMVLRFNPFFLKVGLFFVGWRSDKPTPGAFGKEWAPGGGVFDIGFKRVRSA